MVSPIRNIYFLIAIIISYITIKKKLRERKRR